MQKSAFFLIFTCVTSLLGISGCWNKNYNEPGRIEVERRPTEQIVNGGLLRTWAATQAAIAKFPVIKKDIDAASGRAYIVSDWVRGKSDILYHGYDVNRIPYVIRYKLYIYLVGDLHGNRTRVTIKNSEEYLDDALTAGVDIQGSLQTWVKTESSTFKENTLLNQIEKLVQDPKFRADTSGN